MPSSVVWTICSLHAYDRQYTVKPPRPGTTTCTTTPAPALTCVRAGALVPPPPCLGGGTTRVGLGQHPQHTRADFGQEAVGSSQHREKQKTMTRQPTSPTHSPQDLRVAHGSGAWFRGRVTLNVTRCERERCVHRENTLSSSLPLLPGKYTVVSAFKNPDSGLKSLCQRKETGVARRRE